MVVLCVFVVPCLPFFCSCDCVLVCDVVVVVSCFVLRLCCRFGLLVFVVCCVCVRVLLVVVFGVVVLMVCLALLWLS